MKLRPFTIDEIKADLKRACVGGPFGSELTQSDYVDDGVPVIRGGNLRDDREFCDDGFVFVSEQKADELAANIASRGDIIFTQRGTLGQVGLIPDTSRFEKYIISQSQMKLTVNRSIALAKYIFYYFRQKEMIELVKGQAITSGVPHINLGILKNIRVHLPDVEDQARIVTFIDNYSNLIANNKRRIELLERSARMLFKQWFVYLRYPGHEHDKLVDGVPKGWERRQLGDVLTLKRGYDLPAKVRADGNIPIVSSSGITGYHNEKKGNAPGIVTGRYGTLGVVYYLDQDYWPLNTALYVSDKKGNPPLFLVHFLEIALEVNPSGKAAVPGVNRNDLHSFNVLLPPKPLRDQFHEFADPIYQMRSSLLKANQKLCKARDLMVPRLMDGRISV